ncbi:MAG: fibro-slime domain-containing protein [Chitinivibrionales bacterium]
MKIILIVSAVVLLSIGLARPQTLYPPTFKIPVTFYDFYADGSNPEFEIYPGWSAGLHTGMVAAMLDSQSKPVVGSTPYYNCQIARWFRPWTSGDFTIPNYTNPATTTCGNPLSSVSYDTAFKNIVIQDTLIFSMVLGSAGTYEYNNPNFFPLDGRGFGNEPSGYPHNYSFTMEMHWKFTYVKGLTFNFEGENDLWVFINGHLAVDLGGIHGPVASSINLDSLPGLTTGNAYMFDLFYAQRHFPGSDIKITTNIINAMCTCPYMLMVKKVPNKDTIIVGDSVVLQAIVFDDTGAIRTEVSSQCEWSLSPATTASFLSNAQGGTTTFYANSADQMFSIKVNYNGPDLPEHLDQSPDSIKIYVKPAPASNRIERTFTSENMRKSEALGEFYNLRGQKLQGPAIGNVDGVLFERTVDQNGKVGVKQIYKCSGPLKIY